MSRITKDYKRILENIFSLSLLNGINYVFPLILIPYLTRIVGAENYGKYAFAYSFLLYFTLIVNYGFDFSATKKVAVHRHDFQKLQSIFSAVIFTRILLALVCIVVLLILSFSISKLKDDIYLYLPGIGFIFSFAINPLWLYHGMEKMKFNTVISFLARSVTLILIVFFIKKEEDYKLINLFFASGFLISAIVSLLIALLQFGMKLKSPTLSEMFIELKDGWHIFISTVFMDFYRNSNVIILGLVADYRIVGVYAVSEKIIKAFQSLLNPITRALFPYFGRKLNSSSNIKAIKNYQKFSRYYGFFLLAISLTILFFAKPLIETYLPQDFIKSIADVRIMSFVVFFGSLNFFYGINGLINLNAQKKFTLSVIITGLFNIITCYVLALFFDDRGASLSMLLSEILLFSLLYYFFTRLIKTQNV